VLDADHVVCIEGGRVSAEGSPAKLLTDTRSMFSRAFGRFDPSDGRSNLDVQSD
jgi:ABC-type multidrug transport system fused ATPase/permease subunit